MAVDYSGRFIDASLAIRAGKGVEYGEGQVARLPVVDGTDADRVTFKQVCVGPLATSPSSSQPS